uniref:Transmembrane protein 35B n=1 Tax=Strix occidentalis caurina TaxID=311401 RepID=A0A8D0ENC0_STROC
MAAAFTALRVLLGLFFLLTGAVKLSDQLSADLHRHMKSQFVRFAEVFPLAEFGFVPEPGRYLAVVGWVEVVAGLLLAFGPQLLQEISNFVLSVVMIGESGRAAAAPRGVSGDPQAGTPVPTLLGPSTHRDPSNTQDEPQDRISQQDGWGGCGRRLAILG